MKENKASLSDSAFRLASQTNVESDKIIDKLTLFDDDLMTLVFDQNIEATELILKIILGKPVKVTFVKTQETFRNPVIGRRDITLDIHAKDENGEEMDIEVQSKSTGANVKRARFHGAVMDSRMLKRTNDFKFLKDSYVIFIYKHDKFGKGLPVYRADRIILETGEPLNDGSHIIYVNGNYKGNDDIGKLMKDFRSTKSTDMHFKELSEGLHHYKETEKGRSTMSEIVERYAKKYAKECVKNQTKEMIAKMLTKGKTPEEIADFCDYPMELIEEVQQSILTVK